MKTNELITQLRTVAHIVTPPARELLIAAADELESSKLVETDQFNRWISPDEQQPETFRPVLICREKEPGKPIVEQGHKDLGGWWKVYGTRVKKIICWCPMPEPPKEGSK